MTLLLAAAHLRGPHIDWGGFSPLVSLSGGGVILLVLGLFRSRIIRERILPGATIAVLGATIGLAIWRFHHPETIVAGALRIDDLALELDHAVRGGGDRRRASRPGETIPVRGRPRRVPRHCSLFSVFGMACLRLGSEYLITLFLSIELLSIPLYILCAPRPAAELARIRAEVSDHRLVGGHAALSAWP